MRSLSLAALLFVASTLQAADAVTFFEGFGMSVDESVDAMTDVKSCTMYLESYPILLSIEGKSRLGIWPNIDNLLFAFDGKHLIRVGTAPAVSLAYVSKKRALVPKDAATAAQVIKALATQKTVKIRFADWPGYKDHDVTVESPAFAYVYGIARKRCGWPSLGVSEELPPAKLFLYESKDPGSEGYATNHVEGNQDLGVKKNFDKYGGGCHITIGIHDTLGMQGGKWVSGLGNANGKAEMIVRDGDGKIVTLTSLPKAGLSGAPWPDAEKVARAMWNAGVLGTVSITGTSYPKEKVSLYGFRELWAWGMERCAFPSLEAAAN
jgi:hypothetical protein